PYSSFRGAATRIERLAAATTDLQHLLHQGMTRYGATFWVGANAVIRKRALDEIVEVDPVGGFEVRRYIQDRTVIEDTESSFGLVLLLAYPYDSRLLSPAVLLAALPYFLAMASDLRSCGYRRTDVLRIYGFNLILLPVNLAGVLKSLQQAMTGKKIPFARTPK